jgi:ribosomal protein L35
MIKITKAQKKHIGGNIQQKNKKQKNGESRVESNKLNKMKLWTWTGESNITN